MLITGGAGRQQATGCACLLAAQPSAGLAPSGIRPGVQELVIKGQKSPGTSSPVAACGQR